MNILMTSAGRRYRLLQAFKKASHNRNGYIFAQDMDGLAPTLYGADRVVKLPAVTEDNYIQRLLELVFDQKIKLIVPTIDTELAKLASHKTDFLDLGCRLATSDIEFVNICSDKWFTVQTFSKVDVTVPASWLPEQPDYIPQTLFVKPRTGSASINTYMTSKNELPSILSRVPNAIIQEYLPYDEITIDSLLDFDGNLIHYVPRKRIRTVGGESIQGVTIDDQPFRSNLLHLFNQIGLLGGRGPITVQAFIGPKGLILSEINPRFGGGFPLGLAAGGDYPEWLAQMVEGERVPARMGQYQIGLYMTRYYMEIITEFPFE